MGETLGERVRSGIRHAFNSIVSPETEQFQSFGQYGAAYGYRPDRPRSRAALDKSIVSSIYTRIGIDVAAVEMKHVRVDQNGRYMETMKSGLQNCLTVEANIDQAARAFRFDMIRTLFDKGHIAIIPVDTTIDPRQSASYDITTMRVGHVVQWYPEHVRVSVWNDKLGKHQEVMMHKKFVAIVENPFYDVMNEQNSTLQRLIRKLSLIDSVDEQAGSGKLDLIIQLPYVIKSEARKTQAESRRKDIETQLQGSKYGIAYTDGTEKVTQLNRPAENNMLKQIEYLTDMLYGQLGITKEVFLGTASEEVMLNYHNRTIEPLLTAITQEIKRKFLTKTARSQGQSVEFYRDPFKLVSIKDVAEIADKLLRNEVVTSNEIRAILGLMPSDDPKADKLVNANMPQEQAPLEAVVEPSTPVAGELEPL